MKRIVLLVVIPAALGTAFYRYPSEFIRCARLAGEAIDSAWQGVAANPLPVTLAVGTFLLTAVYHKAKGKSLRESVEVAATRVSVISVPVPVAAEPESAVVARAKARATRAQLVADQILLENRQRKLPEAITKAEQEACYTEQAVADAARVLADRKRAHEAAVGKLEALRKERSAGEAEAAAIAAELKRLAEVV